MKVTLPEKTKIGKKQAIIYISIISICLISIIAAFYVQFYARIDIATLVGLKEKKEFGKKTEDEVALLKANFNTIFINDIENDDDENNGKKEEQDKKIVYTKYEKKESKVNSYDLEVHIPYININNDVVKKYNQDIEEIFANKARSILSSENKNIIYNVEYVANIHYGILSVMVKSNLKEGSNAQKVIVQTYNYDLRNNKEISIAEMLKIKGADNQVVQSKIDEEISAEEKKVEDWKNLGYNIYNRDTSSSMYKLENASEFYATEDTLYIVYAYGNQTSTSEMDLVIL